MTQNIRLNTEEAQHISYKRIFFIALPLVLHGLSFTIMSFADRLFLVQYDVSQSAASGSALMVAITVTGPINAIILFGSNMVAQYYGAKRFNMLATPIWTSLVFAGVMSVVLLAIIPLFGNIFHFFGHSSEMVYYEKAYIKYIFASGILVMFTSAFLNYFTGTGQTIKVMMVAVIANMVNIGLDWGLIFGHGPFPEMGIKGAGLATVLGNVVALTLSFGFYWLASRKEKSLLKPVFDWDVLRRMLHFGLPAGFQMMLEMGAFTVMILAFARISPEVAVATGLAFQIQSFVYMPVVSLASGGAIIAGQERGAKNFHTLKLLVNRILLLTLSYSVVAMAIFWLFPDQLVNFFENKKEPQRWQEVLDIARPLMLITGVWLIPDAFYNVYMQILKAVGDGVFIMKAYIIVAPLVVVLPAIFLMRLDYSWVVPVIYGTTIVYVVVLWAVFGLRYKSGLWSGNKVIE
jgi:MATE family multidrug resistance protein